MDVTIPYRFKVLGNTADALAADPGIPRERELVVETDTGFFKIGNGTTAYSALPYAGIYPSSSIPYDNTTSGLSATNVKAAIDEIDAAVSAGGSDASLKTVSRFFDECHWASVVTGGWLADISSGTLSVQQDVSDMSGVYAASSGASSGNRAAATAPGFKVTLGAGEVRCRFRVRPQTVPGASNQIEYTVGLLNNVSTSSTNRILLDTSDSSPGWKIVYIHPSGNSTSTTTLAVVAGVTINLDLVINAAGNQVSFYADDVLIDQVALPYTFAAMHPMFMSRKSGVNGGASTLWVDKVLIERDL